MGVAPHLLDRIRGEFREMPGLKISITQACRLWNLNEEVCRDALDALIAEGFLLRTPSGGFIALPSALRMEKAALLQDCRTWRCPNCQHLNSVPAIDASRVSVTFRCTACTRIVSGRPASA